MAGCRNFPPTRRAAGMQRHPAVQTAPDYPAQLNSAVKGEIPIPAPVSGNAHRQIILRAAADNAGDIKGNSETAAGVPPQVCPLHQNSARGSAPPKRSRIRQSCSSGRRNTLRTRRRPGSHGVPPAAPDAPSARWCVSWRRRILGLPAAGRLDPGQTVYPAPPVLPPARIFRVELKFPVAVQRNNVHIKPGVQGRQRLNQVQRLFEAGIG